jgi:hypothetical protein
MKHDLIEYDDGTTILSAIRQPTLDPSAKPYLKALGFVTTLLITRAGFCAN